MALSRRSTIGTCVFALAAGVLLALWLRPTPKPVRSTYFRTAPSRPGMDAPLLASVDPESSRMPEPAAGEAVFAVRVVDDATGDAIGEADVAAFQEGDVSREVGLPIQDDLLGSARTDAAGVARLRLARRDSLVWIVVSRAGYVTERLRASRIHDAVRLSKGETVSGVVVDAKEAPVGGVTVLAEPVDAVGDPEADSRHQAYGTRVSTRADREGRFELTGLRRETYLVCARGDEWSSIGARGTRRVVVEAPATGVRVRVRRVGVFRVRLLDGFTGEPIGVRPSAVAVAETPFVEASPHVEAMNVQLDGTTLRCLSPYDPPSDLLGCVTMSGPSTGDPLEIFLQVDGYRPAAARVTLRSPRTVGSSTEVDEVRLEPSDTRPRGALHVDCSRVVNVWRPPVRVLLFAEQEQPGVVRPATPSYVGRALGSDVWEFRGVPVGRHHMQVFDGVTRSDVMSVDVVAGAPIPARATFHDPTGFTLDLRSPIGHRIFLASAWLRSESGAESLVGQEMTSAHVSGGRIVPGFQTLPPGRYRLLVVKAGYAPLETDFSVSDGAVTNVRCDLSPAAKK